MTHFSLRIAEVPLSAQKAEFVRLVGRYVVARIADLNRYIDTASCVHPVGRQKRETDRQRLWQGSL